MADMSEEKKKTIFDQYYELTEKEYNADQKGLIRSALQRSFETSYDDAFDNILDLNIKMKDMLSDQFESFDLNAYRGLVQDKKLYKEAMEEIEELHVEFFGEQIRNKR